MDQSRRRWRAGMLAAVAVVVPAGLAWACVGLMALTTVGPSTVAPGGTVTVWGREFAAGSPVDIHLDSPTGPVLATAPPPTETMTSQFKLDVPIPPNIRTGEHVLVATQAYHDMNVGAPARTVIHVGAPAPPPPTPEARPAKVVLGSGPSVATLLLVGLAVTAAGLILAALVFLAASRRRPDAEPGAVRAS